MAAGKLDISIEQFADWSLDLETSEDAGSGPAAVDWTGYSVRMQIRPTAGSRTILLQLDEANGRAAIVGGTVSFSLDNEETARLTFGEAVYDVLLESATDAIRLIEGAAVVSEGVTR